MKFKGRSVSWIIFVAMSTTQIGVVFAAAPVDLSSANASTAAAKVVTVKVIPGLTGKLQAVESTFCGGLADDDMTLIVYEGSKTLEEIPFCSSYGKATANVVADAHGVSYILLDFGVGRGTNAVTEYLDVFPAAKDMVEFAHTPLSEGAGPVLRWNYNYDVISPPSGGIVLTFNLRIEGDGPVWVALPEKTRSISIGTFLQNGPVVFRSTDRVF
ncbi:MAG: hypothetical protein WBR29_07850 [Gammaproteobacteria bacterium]